MTTTPTPSVAVMKLSKAGYIELCDKFRDKALQDHQDMRAWMNRALLAESRLATLRAEYEPGQHPHESANNPHGTGRRPDINQSTKEPTQ